LRLGDQFVHRLRRDGLLLGGHIDPATLAAQVAAIDDRDIQERRKNLAPLQPALVLLDREHPLPAHIPGQLPEKALIGFEEHALGQLEQHGSSWVGRCKAAGSPFSDILYHAIEEGTSIRGSSPGKSGREQSSRPCSAPESSRGARWLLSALLTALP